DGKQVEFVGEADAALKRELYRRAKCLLVPLQWDEPFGLVMIEAMACGTPPIAINRGAAPEIITDSHDGFLVRDIDDMSDMIPRVDSIDPGSCRRTVEERFSPETLAQHYLDVYEMILAQEGKARRSPIASISQAVSGSEAGAPRAFSPRARTAV